MLRLQSCIVYASCAYNKIAQPGANLVVKVVEDAGGSHLLEELIATNRLKGTAVCSRPLAALHQDSSWCAVQERRNGDEPKEVDTINVLHGRKKCAISTM